MIWTGPAAGAHVPLLSEQPHEEAPRTPRPVGRCEEHDERKCRCCSRCPECKRLPGNGHYYAARCFPCAVCG